MNFGRFKVGDRVQVLGDYFGSVELEYANFKWPIGVYRGTIVGKVEIYRFKYLYQVQPDAPGYGHTEIRASLLKKI